MWSFKATEPVGCIYGDRERESDLCKTLACEVMMANKFQDLHLASWRCKRAEDVVLVRIQRLDNQEN